MSGISHHIKFVIEPKKRPDEVVFYAMENHALDIYPVGVYDWYIENTPMGYMEDI